MSTLTHPTPGYTGPVTLDGVRLVFEDGVAEVPDGMRHFRKWLRNGFELDGVEYDPRAHKVDEVVAYLDTATPEEVARVQEAEGKASRPRTGVMGYAPPAEGENA